MLENAFPDKVVRRLEKRRDNQDNCGNAEKAPSITFVRLSRWFSVRFVTLVMACPFFNGFKLMKGLRLMSRDCRNFSLLKAATGMSENLLEKRPR